MFSRRINFGIVSADYYSILFNRTDKRTSTCHFKEFDAEQKQKLWLFNEVGGDYRQFVLLREIVNLESSWKETAIGDNGKAWGLVQFHEPTFNQFKQEAGMNYLEYKNPYHQLTLLVWSFENGKEKHWTTYPRAKWLTKK